MNEELVAELFEKAFGLGNPRDRRSDAYKMGVRSALNYRCCGKKMECPFSMGTAEADAYFAGANEGHELFHDWREATS